MKKTLLIVCLVFAALISAYFALKVYFLYTYARIEQVAQVVRLRGPSLSREDLAKRKAAWKRLKGQIAGEMSDFNGTVGLVVKDLAMNWEINSNKDVAMPSASVVKLPVMMAYFQAERDKKADMQALVKLEGRDKVPGAGPMNDAPNGAMFTVKELMVPMITESDNTAANLLIDYLGFDTLNAYFRVMGLQHTNLSRRMMDFDQRRRGVENYSTAGDMAYLLDRLYRGTYIDVHTSRECLGILAASKVNDRIPKYLPAGTKAAHKTGLENGICHDVGIVYTKKGAYLICVMTRHRNKNAREAKKMIAGISLLVYNYLNDL